jgi:hypothetical protein
MRSSQKPVNKGNCFCFPYFFDQAEKWVIKDVFHFSSFFSAQKKDAKKEPMCRRIILTQVQIHPVPFETHR